MPLNLSELDAEFIKLNDETGASFSIVERINDADGIMFVCPKCHESTDENKGAHSIICWAPHVPQTVHPVPGRWNLIGTGLHDLELKNGSSSVAIGGKCQAHFFVRDGKIINC